MVAGISDFYALPEVIRYYGDLNGDEGAGKVAGFGLVLIALFSFVVAVVYVVLAILNGREAIELKVWREGKADPLGEGLSNWTPISTAWAWTPAH